LESGEVLVAEAVWKGVIKDTNARILFRPAGQK
jgi:hypothetical protein